MKGIPFSALAQRPPWSGCPKGVPTRLTRMLCHYQNRRCGLYAGHQGV